MLFLTNKIALLAIAGLILLCTSERTSAKQENKDGLLPEPVNIMHPFINENAYREIVFFQNRIIAVGNGGRIDIIDKSGEKIPVSGSGSYNYNCAVTVDDLLIVAGDNGTIMYALNDLRFTKTESGTDYNIHSITVKSGLLVAGADKGSILISKNGKTWSMLQTQAAGNIISVAANDSFFIGISDKGEILKSVDGMNWQVTDYNKVYKGYNKYCNFRKITASKSSIAIIGTYEDGSPSVIFSSLGNVWTERLLIYDDEKGITRYLESKPNDVTYDQDRDQFILACDNGELFSLPGCTKCNTYAKISSLDLYAIIYGGNYLVVTGDGYYVSVIRL